jgi:hypothetical protein|eukprot:gene12231-biopygen4326
MPRASESTAASFLPPRRALSRERDERRADQAGDASSGADCSSAFRWLFSTCLCFWCGRRLGDADEEESASASASAAAVAAPASGLDAVEWAPTYGPHDVVEPYFGGVWPDAPAADHPPLRSPLRQVSWSPKIAALSDRVARGRPAAAPPAGRPTARAVDFEDAITPLAADRHEPADPG